MIKRTNGPMDQNCGGERTTLTRGAAHVTDATNAARTMLMARTEFCGGGWRLFMPQSFFFPKQMNE